MDEQFFEIDRIEKEILEYEAKKQYELDRIQIPKFLYKSNFNFTEARVLGFIISYHSDKFFFSNKHLAEMFNVSEKSISLAITKLKDEGLINVKYFVKAGGGQIRFITKSERLLELVKSDWNEMESRTLRLEENVMSSWKKTSSPAGNKLPGNNNKINNNKINNKPPIIPPFEKGEHDGCDFSSKNILNSKKLENPLNQEQSAQPSSKIDLNEGECPCNELAGGTQPSQPAAIQNADIIENKADLDDCGDDIQRLIDFWVQIEYPDLYQHASNGQRQEIFKRFSRDASFILKVAGNLQLAKEAIVACRNWLMEKELAYNLTTIANNISKFLNETIRKYPFPPETDLELLEEYKRLYRELKGKDVDQLELANLIRQRVKEGNKDANEVLVEGIRKIKQRLNGEINKVLAEGIQRIKQGLNGEILDNKKKKEASHVGSNDKIN